MLSLIIKAIIVVFTSGTAMISPMIANQIGLVRHEINNVKVEEKVEVPDIKVVTLEPKEEEVVIPNTELKKEIIKVEELPKKVPEVTNVETKVEVPKFPTMSEVVEKKEEPKKVIETFEPKVEEVEESKSEKEEETLEIVEPEKELPKEEKTPEVVEPEKELPKEEKTPEVVEPKEELPKEEETPEVVEPKEELPKEERTPEVVEPEKELPKEESTPEVETPKEEEKKEEKVEVPEIKEEPSQEIEKTEEKEIVEEPEVEEEVKKETNVPKIEVAPSVDRMQVEQYEENSLKDKIQNAARRMLNVNSLTLTRDNNITGHEFYQYNKNQNRRFDIIGNVYEYLEGKLGCYGSRAQSYYKSTDNINWEYNFNINASFGITELPLFYDVDGVEVNGSNYIVTISKEKANKYYNNTYLTKYQSNVEYFKAEVKFEVTLDGYGYITNINEIDNETFKLSLVITNINNTEISRPNGVSGYIQKSN